MSAGVCSSVWTSVGMSASFISTAIAPATLRSSVVIGLPSLSVATTMRPSRSRMSRRSVESAKIAMHSLATVMSKPSSRG
jgi:hypothetical protein